MRPEMVTKNEEEVLLYVKQFIFLVFPDFDLAQCAHIYTF